MIRPYTFQLEEEHVQPPQQRSCGTRLAQTLQEVRLRGVCCSPISI